ncbi:MAG: SDR family oxidoreductase [Gammaproteobacteria bacterium]|nr:SDR family oxidoreductase [Gammaproteobacteria bacterium]MDH3448990.1 SDR family oxidoreductase [Gammaproteobacteria bacterium]
MSKMLHGKTAFVTGGSGGIGSAICARFAREGARVIAADLAQPDEQPEGIEFITYDVTDAAVCQQTFAALSARWDRLDILVNAAAIEIEKTIEETTLEEWNRIFAINVTGMFLTSKYALPLMRKSGGGSIINFGSYDGYIADPGLAAYCATKGAVHALTRAMACDHGPEGIRVNAICPGYVDTPMLRSFFGESGDIESLQQAVRDLHPTRSYGTPQDIANLVNWLASDEARYASGQLWIIDGGLSAQVQQMNL